MSYFCSVSVTFIPAESDNRTSQLSLVSGLVT